MAVKMHLGQYSFLPKMLTNLQLCCSETKLLYYMYHIYVRISELGQVYCVTQHQIIRDGTDE